VTFVLHCTCSVSVFLCFVLTLHIFRHFLHSIAAVRLYCSSDIDTYICNNALLLCCCSASSSRPLSHNMPHLLWEKMLRGPFKNLLWGFATSMTVIGCSTVNLLPGDPYFIPLDTSVSQQAVTVKVWKPEMLWFFKKLPHYVRAVLQCTALKAFF